MTLNELTLEENRLMAAVASATGLMEEKHAQLAEAHVFEAYARVHGAYVDLAERDGNKEALKRAVFLQWYALSEPSCFTGLFKVDDNAQRRAFEQVEFLLEKNELDDEFAWMLPYYYRITDYYLDRFKRFEKLKAFCIQNNRELWADSVPKRESLLGRGQMSRYWLSITPKKTS